MLNDNDLLPLSFQAEFYAFVCVWHRLGKSAPISFYLDESSSDLSFFYLVANAEVDRCDGTSSYHCVAIQAKVKALKNLLKYNHKIKYDWQHIIR